MRAPVNTQPQRLSVRAGALQRNINVANKSIDAHMTKISRLKGEALEAKSHWRSRNAFLKDPTKVQAAQNGLATAESRLATAQEQLNTMHTKLASMNRALFNEMQRLK